jgi:hypothetical protein
MKHILIPALIALGLTAGLMATTACSVEDTSSNNTPAGNSVDKGVGAKDAAADVKLISFEEDEKIGGVYMGATGVIQIVNHSSKTSDYYIEVSIEDKAGTNIDWTNAIAQKVRPNQKAQAEFMVYNEDAYEAIITEVQRTAS